MSDDDLLARLRERTPRQTVNLGDLTSEDLTRMHLAVEDVLIEFRDARMGVLGRTNGFVVNEANGTPSDVMRLSTRDGLRIALAALFGVDETELPR